MISGDVDTFPDDPTGELGWLQASDGLLRGLIHGLNNRVASLSAIVQVMAGQGAAGAGLEDTLLEEIERLSRVIDLLRMVPRRRSEPSEPVHVADLLPELLEALPLHAELDGVTFEAELTTDLLPTLCPPNTLSHALCMLMVAGAQSLGGGGGSVIVRCSGSSTEVLVEISSRPEDDDIGATVSQTQVDPKAAERLLREAGAVVRVLRTDGVHRIELRLPTLGEARRHEAAGPAL